MKKTKAIPLTNHHQRRKAKGSSYFTDKRAHKQKPITQSIMLAKKNVLDITICLGTDNIISIGNGRILDSTNNVSCIIATDDAIQTMIL